MFNLNNIIGAINVKSSVKTGDCCVGVKSKQFKDEKSPLPG